MTEDQAYSVRPGRWFSAAPRRRLPLLPPRAGKCLALIRPASPICHSRRPGGGACSSSEGNPRWPERAT